jgi:hypothetical protein
MISFTQHLQEAKNTHITHLEDDIFLTGYDGAMNSIRFVREVVNAFSSNVNTQLNVSVKWDGAPAIFAGINPENGKFFVGTKGVFNKNAKLNYTKADIQKNHSGGLVQRLTYCLDYLPELNIKGIIQGDMLFVDSDLSEEKIDGKSYLTFTPNTITYAVEKGTPLAREISSAKMGIVWHTSYNGKDITSLAASPGVDASSLRKSRNVWFDDAQLKNLAGTVTFTATESQNIEKALTTAEQYANRLKGFLNFLSRNEELRSYLEMYVNAMVKVGSGDLSVDTFKSFVEDREMARINKLKQQTAIDRGKEKIEGLKKNIQHYSSALNSMFLLHKTLRNVKMMVMKKLDTISSFGHFVRTDNGFRVTGAEGFVIGDVDGKTVKLVDRLEFSRINFTAAKNWI